jgi:hypothetical protein
VVVSRTAALMKEVITTAFIQWDISQFHRIMNDCFDEYYGRGYNVLLRVERQTFRRNIYISFSHSDLVFSFIFGSEVGDAIESKGFGDVVYHSGLLGFWILPIVQNSKNWKMQRFGNCISAFQLKPKQIQFPEHCVF